MAKSSIKPAPEFNVKDYTYLEVVEECHVEGIINLYRKTYQIYQDDPLQQTSYPYPEVLDPEWIVQTSADRDTIWKVVIDSLTGNIIGSGTLIMDRTHQRAYVRGILVDPDYQGYGVAGYILAAAFKEVIRDYQDIIKIFWTENRTAHRKSQKVAEQCGMRPVALLPNKDYFLEQRESDMLYVLYSMNTMKRRRPTPALVPGVLPIYQVVGRQFRLNPIEAVLPPTIHANGYDVKGAITFDKYLYQYATFTANGKKLQFEINPRTQVAEKTKYSLDIDPITLKTLLKFAFHTLNPHLYYMECYVSAYEPAIQQVFLDVGFQATGYIPAWDVVERQREDVIVMTWVKNYPPLMQMQLTPRATKLANLFLS